LVHEAEEKVFVLPYDNDVKVGASIYRGMVYIHSYTGGMPGDSRAQQGVTAIELLKRNWDDPFGRLSLDADDDLVWESQVPSEFLTPDYLAILTSTCANQVAAFWEVYGQVPFNEQ